MFCAKCFCVLPSKSLHICQTCQMARFCSPRCLSRSHPPLLCRALHSLFGETSCPPELLFLLCAYCCDSDVLLQLLSLHSSSDFSPDDDFIRRLNSQILPLLPLLPRTRFPSHFSRQITAHLLSIEKSNSFPIFNPRDPEFDHIGVGGVRAKGIYFRASFFNHDCMPNACPFNYIDEPGRENNTSLIFRAMHRILKGTDICISYVALDTGYPEKQERLLENYGFECNCARCEVESQWEENCTSAEEDDEKENEEEKVKGGKRKEIPEMPEEKMDSKGTGVLLEMPEEKVDHKGAGVLLEMPEEKVDRKGKGKLLEMPEEKVDRKGKGKLLQTSEEKVEACKGKRKGALEISEEADNFASHTTYLAIHMCDCGGCLAPFPASDSRSLLYSKECNRCGMSLQLPSEADLSKTQLQYLDSSAISI